jgi:hypothetical protein
MKFVQILFDKTIQLSTEITVSWTNIRQGADLEESAG